MRSAYLPLSVVTLLCLSGACAQAQAPEQPIPGTVEFPAQVPAADPAAELLELGKSIDQLRAQQQAAQGAAQQDDKVKQQLDLLQKQIEVQQKMIQLLAEQLKKQPAGAAMEKLQTQVITLEARSKQAAQRDQELAGAVDKVVEHQDAVERYGPALPAPL